MRSSTNDRDCWYRAFAALHVPGGAAAIMARVQAADTNSGPFMGARFASERATLLLFKDRIAPVPAFPPDSLPASLNAAMEPPLWAQIAASVSLSLTVSCFLFSKASWSLFTCRFHCKF